MATIEKRGDGYKIVVSNGYDLQGRQIRARITWTPEPGMTAKQVEKELQRQTVLFEEQVKNEGAPDSRINLRDFSLKFIKDYANVYLKAKTVQSYKENLEKITLAIGHIKLCNLKTAHINQFYANLQEDGMNQHTKGKLAASSVMTIHRTLHSVLSKAVKWGYIKTNPATASDRPHSSGKEAAFLDEPDARRLLELLQKEPIKWQAVITFDLLSGLRRGELLGLRWSDIDIDAHTISVKQTSNYLAGKGVYTSTPKSHKSARPLHLSGTAFLLLLTYQRWQDGQKVLLGDAWQDKDSRVFTTDDGTPMFPDSVTQWFAKFVKRTGLPKVTIHSLRHTFASLMIADGTPLIVVSKQLGHAQSSTTSNIYAHVIASAEAKATHVLDKFADCIGFKALESKGQTAKPTPTLQQKGSSIESA